jgi:hypothetical protein
MEPSLKNTERIRRAIQQFGALDTESLRVASAMHRGNMLVLLYCRGFVEVDGKWREP